MFQLFPDTTSLNTVPFFLKEPVIVSPNNTLQKDFSTFEYLSTDSTRLFFETDTALTTVIETSQTGFQGVPLPFPISAQTIVFFLFLLCFVLFAFVFKREGTAVMGNFYSIFSSGNRHRESIYKGQVTATETWGEVFLMFQAMTILSIILFAFSWNSGLAGMSLKNSLYFLGGAFVLLGLFFGLRFLMYKAIGSFMFSLHINAWIERYFWIVELMGVLSFLPAMFYVYVHEFASIALFVLFALFILSRLVIIVLLLIFFVKNKIGILYFIVYLCGVEIAPYLFVYRGAISIMNIIGGN